MTPMLKGRLQTRLFVSGTVGVLWTAAVTPLLPVPSGMDIALAYRMTFESLGLMASIGLFWELAYHLVQQARWDKDWPTLLSLLTVGNEAVVLWFVGRGLHVLPATALPPFAIHIGTTWLVMWLFLQGPVRVLHIRWRFEGGRVFVPAPGRRRRRDDWLDTRWLESLRSPRIADPPTVPAEGARADVLGMRTGPATLVEGVLCPNGHFGNADARYCAVCGTATATSARSGVLGPRPPVGVLILADGMTRVLSEDLGVTEQDGGLVFEPLAGQPATPYLAEIRIVGWQPVIVSPAGTLSVVLPDGGRLRTAPNVPVPLVPGARVVLGGHSIRYDSPYAADPDVDTEVLREKGAPVAMGSGARPNRLSPSTKRTAAAIAAVVTLAALVTFGIVSGLTPAGNRRVVANPGPTTPALPPFSVPAWTLPAQPSTTTPGLRPIELPGPPHPTFSLPLPPPPGGTTTPPVPVPPTTPPGTTDPSPTDTPPDSPLPTASLCTADLMGLLQCTMGGLGG
ncbi:MAG TPA: hypothetical protein VF892_11740 [Pseudonocardiaceae bacterium]